MSLKQSLYRNTKTGAVWRRVGTCTTEKNDYFMILRPWDDFYEDPSQNKLFIWADFVKQFTKFTGDVVLDDPEHFNKIFGINDKDKKARRKSIKRR